MNIVLCILFVLCVLGFSISTVISPTAQTFLRDHNPRIQCWNYVLLGFAVLLANFIRLPMATVSPFAIWAKNFIACLFIGAVLFCVVFIVRVCYSYWRNEMCI